jgi:T-complex protein 1 subunit alpha
MFFQYFVEAGAIAVRRVRKEDMRHVAKATGATLVNFYPACVNDITFQGCYLLLTLANS